MFNFTKNKKWATLNGTLNLIPATRKSGATKEVVFTIARWSLSVQSGISMNKTLHQIHSIHCKTKSIDDACHSTVMYQVAFLVFVLEMNASIPFSRAICLILKWVYDSISIQRATISHKKKMTES